MFSNLFSLKPTDAVDEIDEKQAMAALMVRIAKSDDDYAITECERIEAILSVLYSLSSAEAAKLRNQAETLEANAPDTVRFTRAIKDAVPYEGRFEVVRALWQVVLADGERDHEEDALMRLLASLLGVNDRDSAIARQRA
ncbi:MAG: TerB family tellurite resistance protein [Planktomarina sp.]|nr:TerB family tellurite resistance protein [Planktomarina sp.]MDT2032828.1 TerB family tellurite resistance protein [Planktomarina sp.]MDT2039339.1 TerB family tellurite resistance protein [Planktomarina sp.]MDT2049142.1 TerB family tellurite resistance protein [Planktomarina sp.]|tara:strand:- start:159 stop:578 length:420 start_codon:yes stop_codon:yes gene_type:complete